MLGYQRGIVLFHQDIVLLGSIFVVNFLLDFHIVILVFFVFSVVLAQHCIDFVILMFVDVLATVEHFQRINNYNYNFSDKHKQQLYIPQITLISKIHKYHFSSCITLSVDTLKFNFLKPAFLHSPYFNPFFSFSIYLIFYFEFIKQRVFVQTSALAVDFLDSLIRDESAQFDILLYSFNPGKLSPLSAIKDKQSDVLKVLKCKPDEFNEERSRQVYQRMPLTKSAELIKFIRFRVGSSFIIIKLYLYNEAEVLNQNKKLIDQYFSLYYNLLSKSGKVQMSGNLGSKVQKNSENQKSEDILGCVGSQAEKQENSKGLMDVKGQQSEINKYTSILPQYLICSLCQKLVIYSATTICEHIFCEVCLLQHFVYMSDCPICGKIIRNENYSKNIALDNMADELLGGVCSKNINHKLNQEYVQRKKNHLQYLKQRRIQKVEVGLKIDAQDAQGIWRKAKVMKITNNKDGGDSEQITVKYDGISKRSIYKAKSHKLVKLNFYSERNNIPKLIKGKIVLKDPENEEISYFYKTSDGKVEKQSDS